MKNIYLVKRTDEIGWDEYDAAMVVSDSEANAKKISPNDKVPCHEWKDQKVLEVTLVGSADKSQDLGDVILASFRAG